jgi:beta-lactamase regulating signal transducer with metallopeptidase domain
MLALNGIAAAAIALPALFAARLGRQAIAHSLWVLLLAKLLVPAPIGLRLPEAAASRSRPSSPTAALVVATAPASESGTADLRAAAPWSRPPLLRALLALEVVGALAILGTAALRAMRFRRLIGRGARFLPAARVLPVARRLGLHRAPPVRLVDAPIPPALWSGPPYEILIPADLWKRLDLGQREALLAHELAHVRRRDHWVRPLELLATAVTWWYPLTWWARARLRASEEVCCDALVIRAAAADPRAYTGALIETLSFLARKASGPVPALATGAGDFASIQERFAMILRRETDSPPSRVTRAALLALGLIVLLVGPSGTKGAVNGSTAPPTAAAPEAPEAPAAPAPPAEPAWAAELDRLRAREMELQRRIEGIEMQRARLEVEMQEWQAKSEALRVQREAAELERQGHAEEAKLLREQLALFEAQVSLHRARFEADEAHRKVEQELRDRIRQLEPPHAPTPEAPPHR